MALLTIYTTLRQNFPTWKILTGNTKLGLGFVVKMFYVFDYFARQKETNPNKCLGSIYMTKGVCSAFQVLQLRLMEQSFHEDSVCCTGVCLDLSLCF